MTRIRRVTALVWSRIGYAAGCLVAAAGVGIEAGAGWGLVVGGAVGAASFLLLVDVDEKGDGDGR